MFPFYSPQMYVSVQYLGNGLIEADPVLYICTDIDNM